MYCVKCGVKLADTERECPLCQTKVYHPDLEQPETDSLYPLKEYPEKGKHPKGLPAFATAFIGILIFVVLLCDLRISNAVTWSGYVIGSLVVVYTMLLFPLWFPKRHPAIFVPSAFMALGAFLLYINFATEGAWFLSLAFPIWGFMTCVITAVAVLLYYFKKAWLFIFGGAGVVLGFAMPLLEYLIQYTFSAISWVGWSFYPFMGCVLVGGFFIFLGICRPAREVLERKLFF